MSHKVINYPEIQRICGFTNGQFKRLDGLFCQAASTGVLNYRSVDCDFETGVATFTFRRNELHPPCLSFIIRRSGPGAVMYELFKEKKGRIARSGNFERVIERLATEILDLSRNGE